MATIKLVDPDGREHWADEASEFVRSGLESGHLRPPGEAEGQGDGEEAEDATVEQDGVGEDADGDAAGSGDAKRAPRRPRQR